MEVINIKKNEKINKNIIYIIDNSFFNKNRVSILLINNYNNTIIITIYYYY